MKFISLYLWPGDGVQGFITVRDKNHTRLDSLAGPNNFIAPE